MSSNSRNTSLPPLPANTLVRDPARSSTRASPARSTYRGISYHIPGNTNTTEAEEPSPLNIIDRDPDGTTTTQIGPLPAHMHDQTPIYYSPTESAARQIFPDSHGRPAILMPLRGMVLREVELPWARSQSASGPSSRVTSRPTSNARSGSTAGRFGIDSAIPVLPSHPDSDSSSDSDDYTTGVNPPFLRWEFRTHQKHAPRERLGHVSKGRPYCMRKVSGPHPPWSLPNRSRPRYGTMPQAGEPEQNEQPVSKRSRAKKAIKSIGAVFLTVICCRQRFSCCSS